MMRHLNIQIFGDVQGVTFRFSAKEIADQLNIKGLVKNLPDRSVYIEVEGEEEQLEPLLEWCREGPLGAKVEKVEVSQGPIKNYSEFTITI